MRAIQLTECLVVDAERVEVEFDPSPPARLIVYIEWPQFVAESPYGGHKRLELEFRGDAAVNAWINWRKGFTLGVHGGGQC